MGAPAPWFDWLSFGDFVLGLVEAFLYGWVVAVLTQIGTNTGQRPHPH
ncbi:MAG: hypothetical protein KatS3mg012_0633 [Gaiellaceae bacterium]|nr:MAG: hypothetical protein KatS3mg012_0633 [Gaiellaceae bacterium]